MMDEQGTRFEVLLEDMGRQLRVLAEASMSHDKKLTDLERTLTQRIDALDVKVVGVAIEMCDLKAVVGKLDGKVDKLDGKVDKLEGKVDKLEGKVDKLEGKVDKLEGKVDKLEGKVGKLEGKVDKLEGKVDKLDGKVDKLEAFALDAAPRLVRIETHLALPALSPRKEMTRSGPSKHHRRKPAKRN